MKEDNLEQFVRENAEGFNSLEPPVMAWDAIEKELPKSKTHVVRKLWPYAWKAAAAVLIFTSAWLLNDYTQYQKSSKDAAKPGVVASSPELSELSDAEAYYTSQINGKQAELARYARQHPEIMEDLKKEFTEMDLSKAELKKDLAESNADEKVIEAIIMSYRIKLEILDQMLAELRKTKEGSQKQEPVETSL